MKKVSNYLRNFADKLDEFVFGYNDLSFNVYNDVITIYDKIDCVSKKPNKKFTEVFPEIVNIKNYAINSYDKISNKVKSLTNIFRKKEKKETLENKINNYYSTKNNVQKNFTSKNEYIGNNFYENTKNLADIISGKKQRLWKDREKTINDYLDNNSFSSNDYIGLLRLKDSLSSNKYLRKKHLKIYNSINEKLDETILEMKA